MQRGQRRLLGSRKCWTDKKDGTDGWNESSNGEFRHCLADLGLVVCATGIPDLDDTKVNLVVGRG